MEKRKRDGDSAKGFDLDGEPITFERVEQYLPIVIAMIKATFRNSRFNKASMDRDDLKQELREKIHKSLEKYSGYLAIHSVTKNETVPKSMSDAEYILYKIANDATVRPQKEKNWVRVAMRSHLRTLCHKHLSRDEKAPMDAVEWSETEAICANPYKSMYDDEADAEARMGFKADDAEILIRRLPIRPHMITNDEQVAMNAAWAKVNFTPSELETLKKYLKRDSDRNSEHASRVYTLARKPDSDDE
jgi:hypothetical protein